jgi:phosphoglycolate phosphatase-like HAD superfamily hydrolase
MNILDHYQHIIFDFDETLATLHIDWSGWYGGISEIILKYEPSTDLPQVIPHTLFNAYVKKYGGPIRKELWEFSADFELKANKGLTPNPTALSLLTSIGDDKKVYLYSSNSRRIILESLEKLGITNRFEKIVARDDVDFIKPDPHGFMLIYDGHSPLTQYVMVGDSSSDSGLAKNAKIDFINVSNIQLYNISHDKD